MNENVGAKLVAGFNQGYVQAVRSPYHCRRTHFCLTDRAMQPVAALFATNGSEWGVQVSLFEFTRAQFGPGTSFVSANTVVCRILLML